MKTLKDIVAERDPHDINDCFTGGVYGCPLYHEYLYDYLSKDELEANCPDWCFGDCSKCWNREVDTNEP